MSKLTWKEVQSIRRLRSAGLTLRQLAALYNVCQSNISYIVRNLSWQNGRHKYIKNQGRTYSSCSPTNAATPP